MYFNGLYIQDIFMKLVFCKILLFLFPVSSIKTDLVKNEG